MLDRASSNYWPLHKLNNAINYSYSNIMLELGNRTSNTDLIHTVCITSTAMYDLVRNLSKSLHSPWGKVIHSHAATSKHCYSCLLSAMLVLHNFTSTNSTEDMSVQPSTSPG